MDELKDIKAQDNAYRAHWWEAIRKEFRKLTDIGTWRLESAPAGLKPIECKWIFDVRPSADGSVKKFKARLVVQGFSQRAGIDFNETFAPWFIRAMFAIAAEENLKMRQIDIVSAYLNAPR